MSRKGTRRLKKKGKKRRRMSMKKGRGLGKHAGHAVIDWVEKHVDGMTSIKLPSNATPFMKIFKKN